MQTSMMVDLKIQAFKKKFWEEWAILAIAGMVGTLSGLPGLWPILQQTADRARLSMSTFLTIQVLSSAIQIALIAAIGLFFAHRVGLGAPMLEQWLKHERAGNQQWSVLVIAVGFGALGAVVVIGLDRLIFAPLLSGFTSIISQVSGWQGFLASFYGGILEELEMRLLGVSVIAWLLGRVSHTKMGIPSQGAFWVAIGTVAILFGLGHLPATSLTVTITPLVVLRAVLLNGILGALFGTMYWKRGLEAAMLCHFSADIVVHVLLPLF